MKFLYSVFAPRRLWFVKFLHFIRFWRCQSYLALRGPHSWRLLLCLWCCDRLFWVTLTILSESVEVWDIIDIFCLIWRVNHVLLTHELKFIVRRWQLARLLSDLYVFSLNYLFWRHLELQILYRCTLLPIMHFILLIINRRFFRWSARYVREAPTQGFGRITICIMICMLLSHSAKY